MAVRALHALALIGLASSPAILVACSKAVEDSPTAGAAQLAQSVQSAIAASQPAQNDHAADKLRGASRVAESADLAPASAPLPPEASSGTAGGLPPAMGAPHLYHLGARSMFLDRAEAIGLSSEQKLRLMSLQESARSAHTITQLAIAQGELALGVLSSAEAPDLAKIEAKIGEITRLTAQHRIAFIRTVGDAVSVLTEAQRIEAVRGFGAPGSKQPVGLPSSAPLGTAPKMPGMPSSDSKPARGMGMEGM